MDMSDIDRRKFVLLCGVGLLGVVGWNQSDQQAKPSAMPHFSVPQIPVYHHAESLTWEQMYRTYATYEGVVMDLPPSMRQENWGGGSCVHASTVSHLRWLGMEELAAWWRQQYSGGEYADRLLKRMDEAGLKWAATTKSDFGLLEWANRTRRGAVIFYKSNHSINFVGISPDGQTVYMLDNNATEYPERNGHYEAVPIEEFKRRWAGYGGFAAVCVYSPTPPVPHTY